MKALALILVLLTVGDVALDHGNGIRATARAASTFAQDFSEDLKGSLFAA